MHKSMSLNYEPSSEPLHISAEQLFLNGGVIRKWIRAKLCSCQFKHFDGHVHAGGPSPPLARLVKQIQAIETDEFLLFWGLVARQALWRTPSPRERRHASLHHIRRSQACWQLVWGGKI